MYIVKKSINMPDKVNRFFIFVSYLWMELNLYINESVLAVILFEKGQTSNIAVKRELNNDQDYKKL